MLSRTNYLQSLPGVLIPQLPLTLQGIKVRQPWHWLLQLHYGEPSLHYEVAQAAGRSGLELGLHFEARDHNLNRFLLDGFRRHLFEIKDRLGDNIEAEMWDKGWTKVYEVYPEQELTLAYQAEVASRLAAMICCFQPIFAELRGVVAQVYR